MLPPPPKFAVHWKKKYFPHLLHRLNGVLAPYLFRYLSISQPMPQQYTQHIHTLCLLFTSKQPEVYYNYNTPLAHNDTNP